MYFDATRRILVVKLAQKLYVIEKFSPKLGAHPYVTAQKFVVFANLKSSNKFYQMVDCAHMFKTPINSAFKKNQGLSLSL